mmetsp:Transcript_9688/g.17379  ORF Transcript_9688/g.17379 Transcript_9688/m.17379 type:complete len:209 (+) Transcript_9688:155-781(+)
MICEYFSRISLSASAIRWAIFAAAIAVSRAAAKSALALRMGGGTSPPKSISVSLSDARFSCSVVESASSSSSSAAGPERPPAPRRLIAPFCGAAAPGESRCRCQSISASSSCASILICASISSRQFSAERLLGPKFLRALVMLRKPLRIAFASRCCSAYIASTFSNNPTKTSSSPESIGTVVMPPWEVGREDPSAKVQREGNKQRGST